MNLWVQLKRWWQPPPALGIAPHLRTGITGEHAARLHLEQKGLKFLMHNFTARRGEIDLIFCDSDCLVFIEVKSRSLGSWTRPAAAVNGPKKRRLVKAAFEYIRALKKPHQRVRFDIVEVLMADHAVVDVRHIENAFTIIDPYSFG